MTAIEWLLQQDMSIDLKNSTITIPKEIINQALEKERQQIESAWLSGYESNDIDEMLEIKATGFTKEKYYKSISKQ